jgi:hypothetical protein
MENKNLMFQLVVKDSIKEKCRESDQVGYDKRRTEKLREYLNSSDRYKYYVFSPSLEYISKDETDSDCEHIYRIPGDPGEWTGNDCSYIVRIERVLENYNIEKYVFNLKIYNYANMGTLLLNKTIPFDICTLGSCCGTVEKYVQFSNSDDKITVDKIRKTLSNCIEEAIFYYIN